MGTFEQRVREYTAEFIQHDGYLTAEFSTSGEGWDEKFRLLREVSATIPKVRRGTTGARWVVFECETCREHHPSAPYHVSIEPMDHWPVGYSQVVTVLDCAIPVAG